MPIPALDLIVLGVTLISAVLATIRGATREILAILAWVVAAAAALLLHKAAEPFVKNHIANETIAKVAAIAGIFLLTLLVVSIITVKISDMVLDSRIGALDRTLGFIFGVLRGLLLCIIGWVMLSWFLQGQNPEWIQGARTRPMLESSGESLQSMVKTILPENAFNDLLKKLKTKQDGLGETEDAPSDTEAQPSETRPAQTPSRPRR